jgi:hypothetical protein
LASVIQASRAIRSDLALTICKSSEMRLASRQLRIDAMEASQGSAAWRRGLHARKAQRSQLVANAIARILSSRGYTAFVAEQPQDTAPIQ